jgi:Fur family ferric uptake transcriptional regulator
MKPRYPTPPEPAPELTHLAERLRQNSLRLTGPRQAILGLLRRSSHPVSSKDILGALPEGECDLATVYRSMRLLQRLGIVHRFDLGDGVARYELVSDTDGGHHHHLVCTNCARVVEIAECFPTEFERRIAEKSNYRDVSHRLEFFGVCPECQ